MSTVPPWGDLDPCPTFVRASSTATACRAPALEYLKRLGVTAVELMPVHHHEGGAQYALHGRTMVLFTLEDSDYRRRASDQGAHA